MKKLGLLLLGGVVAIGFTAQSAQADFVRNEESRTAGRTVPAYQPQYPDWLIGRGEHDQFMPYHSNTDPQNDHPAQWQGQDWDPSQWPAGWTRETAVQKLYENGTLHRQYRKRTWRPEGQMLELDVGPTFYKLSELDQQRVLQLLTGNEDTFAHGYPVVEIRDGLSRNLVGTYTQKGLQLF